MNDRDDRPLEDGKQGRPYTKFDFFMNHFSTACGLVMVLAWMIAMSLK